MSKFNYDESQRGASVETLSGQPVRIIFSECTTMGYPLIGLVGEIESDFETPFLYSKEGKVINGPARGHDKMDLCMSDDLVPRKAYVPMYYNDGVDLDLQCYKRNFGPRFYINMEDAKDALRKNSLGLVGCGTAQVLWDEAGYDFKGAKNDFFHDMLNKEPLMIEKSNEEPQPFDLEKAKAGMAVQTKEGNHVTFVAFSDMSKDWPIMALIHENGSAMGTPMLYNKKGEPYPFEANRIEERSLVMCADLIPRKAYVLLYRAKKASPVDPGYNRFLGLRLYKTQEEAAYDASITDEDGYIDVATILWSEPGCSNQPELEPFFFNTQI